MKLNYISIILLLVLSGCASSPKKPAPRSAPLAQLTLSPLIKVQPHYPNDMLREGMEGWVLYEIEIGLKCHVEVKQKIDASPPLGFDSDALRETVKKWCYKLPEGVKKSRTMALVEFTLQ